MHHRRPAPGEVQLRVRAVGLNHIDVWGFRGMAFAKRRLPLTVGAEAACDVVAVGDGVTTMSPGDRVVPFAALTCGTCHVCRARTRRISARTSPACAASMSTGSHRNSPTIPPGWWCESPTRRSARRRVRRGCLRNGGAHAVRQRAAGTGRMDAGACRRFGHRHASPSRVAKSLGCTVITTVGSDEKVAKASALGADHVINYRTDRFEGVVRKLTAKKGVDVVFEHVGADTWKGSLLSLNRGGRLVTCGATSGPAGNINLMQFSSSSIASSARFGSPLRRARVVRWDGLQPACGR